VCENGYGKQTPFGYDNSVVAAPEDENVAAIPEDETAPAADETAEGAENAEASENAEGEETEVSARSYRRQTRGGLGILDIRTSKRNGDVIGVAVVFPGDQILIMTARGKIQRLNVDEVRVTGRNTQGVRVMNVDADDRLVAVKVVPPEENDGTDEETEE
ncbi:MAG: DNA gyrase subunit A, partial [Thermoguttaceae bacterium]|nr:DNA gyrase subunit A [Thermoguttaceae bacterium]